MSTALRFLKPIHFDLFPPIDKNVPGNCSGNVKCQHYHDSIIYQSLTFPFTKIQTEVCTHKTVQRETTLCVMFLQNPMNRDWKKLTTHQISNNPWSVDLFIPDQTLPGLHLLKFPCQFISLIAAAGFKINHFRFKPSWIISARCYKNETLSRK